jgi:hypothetical protein
MRKKILTLLAMMSIATMMMLSSCTAAGVECGLIGKWEQLEDDDDSSYVITYEITADNKFIITGETITHDEDFKQMSRHELEITEIKDNTIIMESGLMSMEYSELNCGTVKFNGRNFKRVY